MRVLVTRPEDDAAPLATQLARFGIASTIEPLLEVNYGDGGELDVAGVQALLATSANGVRAFARRCARRDLPVLAVGDATARTARDAGFAVVESAAGDVFALAELVRQRRDPAAGALLHAAGSVVAGDLGKLLANNGFQVRREVLYEARTATRLTAPTVELLRQGKIDGVAVFSPRTGAVLIELLKAAGVDAACAQMTAFCLSWAVAGAIEGVRWRLIRVAARPEQAALLDIIADEADFFSLTGRIP
ncbi:MAG: uroporphyrinogen-III synthase [Rhodospirillales bacterium]|nr:uroporphyrinogen-III synthase [Rhodospirillales bacterium]